MKSENSCFGSFDSVSSVEDRRNFLCSCTRQHNKTAGKQIAISFYVWSRLRALGWMLSRRYFIRIHKAMPIPLEWAILDISVPQISLAPFEVPCGACKQLPFGKGIARWVDTYAGAAPRNRGPDRGEVVFPVRHWDVRSDLRKLPAASRFGCALQIELAPAPPSVKDARSAIRIWKVRTTVQLNNSPIELSKRVSVDMVSTLTIASKKTDSLEGSSRCSSRNRKQSS